MFIYTVYYLLHVVLQVLGSSLKLRMDGYVTIRGRIAGRACLYFKNIISRRGYNGTLKFDLEAKKLEIIVSNL